MKENMNNTGFIMAKETMTMETFINVMKDALASRIEGCTVEAHETRKNNGWSSMGSLSEKKKAILRQSSIWIMPSGSIKTGKILRTS